MSFSKHLTTIFSILLVLFVSSFAVAQEKNGKKNDSMPPQKTLSAAKNERAKVSGSLTRNFSPIPPSFSRRQRKDLEPAADIKSRFGQILNSDKTGIFKIFPDYGCEAQNVLRVDNECADFIPGSAFYSIRKKQHTTDVYADLRLSDGFLVSDGFLSQGILVNLGAIALVNVGVNDERLNFIRSFAPDVNASNAARQRKKLDQGVRQNGLIFASSARLIEGDTYVLRVVAYRGKFFRTFRGIPYNALGIDKRKDLTVALHVARIDENGSATIVWRELEHKDSPKIILQQNSP